MRPDESFDRSALRACLTPDAVSRDHGYVAVVSEIDRGNRRRKPVQIMNTGNTFGPGGIFEDMAAALDYANRWVDAYVAKCSREHDLRVRRGLELGDRLVASRDRQRKLEGEKARIAAELKSEKERAGLYLDEARDPEVELYFPPQASQWRLFDAPCETDGTLETMSRQLVISETGAVQPAPVEVEQLHSGDGADDAAPEPKQPSRSKKGSKRKAPPRASEAAKPKKSKAGARGARKRKNAEATSETDAAAGAFEAAEDERPGLDPGAVVWPGESEPDP